MALSLQPRQAQKQAITPAMMVELSLLSLPIGELREAVKKEIDSNPALEVEPARLSSYSSRPSSAPSAGDLIDTVAAEGGVTLEEHLMSELRMAGIEGRELELCHAIVADIDENGRFTGSVPDLRMTTGATAAELEAARRRVMTIDPQGCGARDLAECYLAQIGSVPEKRRPEVEKAIVAVAAMVAGKRVAEPIAPDVLKLLKKLDPFPGRQYDFRRVEFVTPDVIVDEDGDVSVDQRDIPELRVSPKYVEMAKDRSLDEETRRYAAERVKRAREFREAVVRRQETMEKLAELTVGGQPDFLTMGAAGLRKLTMSDVARKAKCTVSTVSRAAARKYVKTPRGTVPLRKFFVLVDQGPVEKLREILEGLPPGEKVSDQKVAELLAKAGVSMARRTVAKYRAQFLGKRVARRGI